MPLINWLFTLGRCRKCNSKIPKTHLFIEASCTILFIFSYLKFSFSEQFILASIISASCIILIVTDFTHKNFQFQVLNLILILGISNRILIDHEIIKIAYSGVLGILSSSIFYKIFSKINVKIFSNSQQIFDYIKFILIASISLNYIDFILCFAISIIIFSIILLLNISNKRRSINNFGYAFIIPFLWLIMV